MHEAAELKEQKTSPFTPQNINTLMYMMEIVGISSFLFISSIHQVEGCDSITTLST